MGFFSAIGSFISGVGSAICSVIGTIGSNIATVLGGIGSKIVSLATALIPGLRELSAIIEIVTKVCTIIDGIAKILGLKDDEDTPEELGMKAEQSDKKPDDFDNVEEYINYLHTQVELDKEKMNNLQPEQRAGYMAVGSAIYIKGLEEKYGMDLPADFWLTVASLKLSSEEVKSYIDSFKANNLDVMDMCDYLKGNHLPEGKSASNISNAMISALHESNPELNEDDLYSKLQDMRLE